MEAFVGDWKLDRSENFEEFLKVMGANFMIRKMATKMTPTVKFEYDGNEVTMTTVTMKAQTIKFQFGQEVNFDHPMDGEQKTTFTMDGAIMKQIQTGIKSGTVTEITREIVDGELKMTMVVKGVTCVRIYKKDNDSLLLSPSMSLEIENS